MKKIVSIFCLCVMAIAAFAQDDDDSPRDPKVREKIEAARIAFITEELQLTPNESEKFWPVYREFIQKRRDIRWELRRLSRTSDSQKSDQEIVDRQLALKQQEVDLEKEYSDRLLKVISAQKLRALPQAERKFRQMILEQIRKRRSERQR